ncbi:cobyric acid synthase [Ligaoa zhengdingensis]|uniref:cobyric acid synthase n=1 Tax=Ligaoa zhengdingensis TaxID=2763658 RepID=UPI0031BA4FA8
MAKAIMIQGTTSNAGKSFLAAALCRIFRQDGYSVAPFKSQNMALNSFITADGLEMGRAQVMQAEAAGIEPDVRMNPILLKPQSDTGSQVIVNGEVWGCMGAAEYYEKKRELIPHIRRAYDELAAQYDIIVLEGAGSPAEINLKENDIVNMGMAKLAGAPVLLCGDIDRGGVFAALAGTLMLLDDDERALVKGTIINKFRGDREILRPGLEMLEKITHTPVLGVVPYLRVDIDDEDSLSDRFSRTSAPAPVEVAVIRLPRISNATDFNVLDYQPGLSVRYVTTVAQLGNPDLVILPGTKNTMEDLLWLRQCGLEAAIQKHAARGGAVFGICGGYQMLGEELCDPDGVEHGGSMAGMGLLPVRTIFETHKARTRAAGKVGQVKGPLDSLSGARFEGYEIHMGRTERRAGCAPLNLVEQVGGEAADLLDGAWSGSVYGSYMHGFFDSEEVAGALVRSLCRAKGLDCDPAATVDLASYKQTQYDLLARAVRESLEMDRIYGILERGV